MGSTWRADINSLSFQPSGHDGHCVVHRRAFQTMLGFEPTPEQCAARFLERHEAFQRAAAAKIARAALPATANFHLTSRDVIRAAIPNRP
jgi:hypothetical protein